MELSTVWLTSRYIAHFHRKRCNQRFLNKLGLVINFETCWSGNWYFWVCNSEYLNAKQLKAAMKRLQKNVKSSQKVSTFYLLFIYYGDIMHNISFKLKMPSNTLVKTRRSYRILCFLQMTYWHAVFGSVALDVVLVLRYLWSSRACHLWFISSTRRFTPVGFWHFILGKVLWWSSLLYALQQSHGSPELCVIMSRSQINGIYCVPTSDEINEYIILLWPLCKAHAKPNKDGPCRKCAMFDGISSGK